MHCATSAGIMRWWCANIPFRCHEHLVCKEKQVLCDHSDVCSQLKDWSTGGDHFQWPEELFSDAKDLREMVNRENTSN